VTQFSENLPETRKFSVNTVCRSILIVAGITVQFVSCQSMLSVDAACIFQFNRYSEESWKT